MDPASSSLRKHQRYMVLEYVGMCVGADDSVRSTEVNFECKEAPRLGARTAAKMGEDRKLASTGG